VFENRALRRIFERKRNEVTGVEKTTQGTSCCAFLTKCYVCGQIKNDMGRACRRGVYRLLVGTAERTTNGRPTNK
jgi:hypothetical protein